MFLISATTQYKEKDGKELLFYIYLERKKRKISLLYDFNRHSRLYLMTCRKFDDAMVLDVIYSSEFLKFSLDSNSVLVCVFSHTGAL